MILEEIRIKKVDRYLSRDRDKPLEYTGSISFSGKGNTITCRLDAKTSAQFLCYASEILTSTAKQAQDELVNDINKCVSEAMNAQTALEFKEDERS